MNLTTIYGGLSKTSNNEAKSVLSIKKFGRDSNQTDSDDNLW